MLVHVSAGYLPVRGWLHTCYSPVRRSPPVYRYTVLPLDLHVLSLSLAFILSQDQTLHTKIIFQKSYLAGSCVHRISTTVDSDSRSLRFVHLNILKNSLPLVFSRSRSSLPSPLSKAAAKVRLVFHSPNFSSFFFKLFFPAPRLTSFPRALSLESGCKDKAMIHPFPNFFTVFFHLFFKKKHQNHDWQNVREKTFSRPSLPGNGQHAPGYRDRAGRQREKQPASID